MARRPANVTPTPSDVGGQAKEWYEKPLSKLIMFIGAFAGIIFGIIPYRHAILDMAAAFSRCLYINRFEIGIFFAIALIAFGAVWYFLKRRENLGWLKRFSLRVFWGAFILAFFFTAIVAFGPMSEGVDKVKVAFFDTGDVGDRRMLRLERRVQDLLSTPVRYEIIPRQIPTKPGVSMVGQLNDAAKSGAQIFLINASADDFGPDEYDAIENLNVPTIWLRNSRGGANLATGDPSYVFAVDPEREGRTLAATLSSLNIRSTMVLRRNGDADGRRFYRALEGSLRSRGFARTIDEDVYQADSVTTPDVQVNYDALVVACFDQCNYEEVVANLNFPAPSLFFTTGFSGSVLPEDLATGKDIFVSTPHYLGGAFVSSESDEFTSRRVFAAMSLVDQVASRRLGVMNRDFRDIFSRGENIYLSSYGFVSLNGNSIKYFGLAEQTSGTGILK